MAEQHIADQVDDLLTEASWNHRLPAMYEAGDPEIVELVHDEGMPIADPLELMAQAIALIIEQMRIVRLERVVRSQTDAVHRRRRCSDHARAS